MKLVFGPIVVNHFVSLFISSSASALFLFCLPIHWCLCLPAFSHPSRRFQTRNAGISSLIMASQENPENAPVWCEEKQIYIGGKLPENAQVQEILEQNDGYLRLFGYGSLCWNPGTILGKDGVTNTLGRAKGYKRCWAQKSTDHRGDPSFPGIVCTLLKDSEVQLIKNEPTVSTIPSMTEGKIYTIPPSLVQECLEELDFREKGGYARDIIDVIEDESGDTHQALLYRGTPDNPAMWERALLDLPYAAGKSRICFVVDTG